MLHRPQKFLIFLKNVRRKQVEEKLNILPKNARKSTGSMRASENARMQETRRARKKRTRRRRKSAQDIRMPHQSIQPFHPSDVKSFPYLPFSHTNSQSQSPHIPRTQPRERIRAVPSTASKTLEVSALVAHMSSAIGRHVSLRHLLRLVKRVHVATQRHRGAALRSLHLLLLLGDAVFGKRLERSLGSKLRVVV